MKVFHYSFRGVWLDGDAIVVAPSALVATRMLSKKLKEDGLDQTIIKLVEIDTTKKSVLIVDNGDY